MLKKELQQQLESIEQTANDYFDKAVEKETEKKAVEKETEKASGMPWRSHPDFNFDDLDPSDKEWGSEISQGLADVVNQIFHVTERSGRFDQFDQLALRDGIRCADAALRFGKYRRRPPSVEHEEGTFLAVIPEDQWEEPISISSSREELMESLNAIGKILMRLPDTGNILLVKEAAKIADVDPKTIRRWAKEPNSFQVIWNKDGSRIRGILEKSFREFLEGRKKQES